MEPSIKAKYTTGTYQKHSFCGGSNIDLKLITCKNKIVILSKLKSYVIHRYHIYILHTGMDRTDAMIFQIFYCPRNSPDILKKVTKCDTCQRTKQSN